MEIEKSYIVWWYRRCHARFFQAKLAARPFWCSNFMARTNLSSLPCMVKTYGGSSADGNHLRERPNIHPHGAWRSTTSNSRADDESGPKPPRQTPNRGIAPAIVDEAKHRQKTNSVPGDRVFQVEIGRA